MLDWRRYLGILRRRWVLVAAVLVLDAIVSGLLFARTYRTAGYQACVGLYVADVSAAGTIAAPATSLEQLGQLLAGESAANFFADDLLDVAQSERVAAFVSSALHGRSLPHTGPGDINGSVSGSRRDRTLSICASSPYSASALGVAGALGSAMSRDRAQFVGSQMAKRTFVRVISSPTVASVPPSRSALNLLLRLFLGALVAIGLALVWDALDPRIRGREDVEQALGVPVLAEGGSGP
jgi:capsular polysaccharide biosynthesis protein